ncbi:class I SAM-dependent methyltransferase [Rugamonas aquatica]|uniref:Methyltransferase domain-containing protein n=1 Tax=Rugamonas aquatica TaxID=2743357 RepID=A0A6A7N5Q9_9BURK|nr:class I SAM-dependent methyltransferase [Rugamonas aquatica]MQA40376.1 methyltransferase domain-containing protein [Rugamonas aquatica]
MTQPPNTFAQRSDQYALARPHYPPALFDWLRQQTAAHDLAWDCATGNGQAAVDLARHYGQVMATDLSPEQVGQGLPAPNVQYSAQPAERTAFAAHSFDLITVAQALHWFDYAAFWPEVRRVAKPGALFCAWGYAWFDCEAEVMAALVMPMRELLAPYWAPNNRILWDGYRDADIAFPFAHVAPPPLEIRERWSVAQLIGYMQTWSSYKKAMLDSDVAARLTTLVAAAQARFSQLAPLHISMPLAIVAGRVHPD